MNCSFLINEKEQNEDNCSIELAGFIIGIISGIFVWSRQLPQIIKGCKTRRLEDMSYKMLILTLIGHTFYLVYGILVNQIPIIANAPIAISTSSCLMIQKYVYNKEIVEAKRIFDKINKEDDTKV